MLVLGAALALLNFSLDFFTLAFNMPWLSILDVLRQSVFNANLLVFWVIVPHHFIFIGEEGAKSVLIKRRTWMIFAAVMIVCLSLPICERAARLHNPFRPLIVKP